MSDREIVYACRYYAPGSRKSYSHLYLIRPDSTGRKQLTYAHADDTEPQWSPDGKWIAFKRDSNLMLLSPETGTTKKLPHMPESWNALRVPEPNQDPLVLGKYTFELSFSEHAMELPNLVMNGEHLPMNGKRLPIIATPEVKRWLDSQGEVVSTFQTIKSLPKDTQHLLLYGLVGNSTNGHWKSALRISVKTGKADLALEYSILCLAPDGKHYVTSYRRDLAPLGSKQVWVRSLRVGRLDKSGSQEIVKGLAFVQGYDWRGGKRSE